MRYRIGVIDDFLNQYAFVDYQEFGTLRVWDGCRVGSAHRGHQLSSDAIFVFLNFKQVGKYFSREEAHAALARLVREAPVDLSDLEYYLFPTESSK